MWTELPRRFDHYRQLMERTEAQIRGAGTQRQRYDSVTATVVTLELDAVSFPRSFWRKNERLWHMVERAVVETFRAGDIKLSDGQSCLVVLAGIDGDDAAAVVRRIAAKLRARLRIGLNGESPDLPLAVGVVLPQQLFSNSWPGSHTEASPARAVYELCGPCPGAAESSTLDCAIRRTVDIVVACVAILISLPLMVLAAVFIRLGSPGPALFRQRRIGRNGKMFTMLKLRTMHVGVDDQPHRSYMKEYVRGSTRPPRTNGTESPIFKITCDERVFPLGAFLRRWSVDELPQLFNVLRGDMSVVGPRPSVYYELEDYQPWHRERLRVKPGLTGNWQVHGRGRTTFDEMVRLDIQYTRRCSIALDLKLLLMTGPAVVGKAGAA